MHTTQPPTRSELRRLLRARRKATSADERARAAHAVAERLHVWPPFVSARHVGAYWPVGAELSPWPTVDHLSRIALPVFDPPSLRWWVAGDPTADKRIPEPLATAPVASAETLDILIVPVVGVDTAFTRLGSGAGWYDRLLARIEPPCRPRLVAFAYDLQVVEHLTREPWDVPVDAICTPTRLLEREREHET